MTTLVYTGTRLLNYLAFQSVDHVFIRPYLMIPDTCRVLRTILLLLMIICFFNTIFGNTSTISNHAILMKHKNKEYGLRHYPY